MRLAIALRGEVANVLALECELAGHQVEVVSGGMAWERLFSEGSTEETPDVVVIEATEHSVSFRETADRAGVRVVAVCSTPDESIRMRALGVVDYVDASEVMTAIPALLEGTSSVEFSDASADFTPGRGTLVALWGAPGAPGATTICLGLAEVWARRGFRVLVIDADAWSASIAAHWGLRTEVPGIAAAARLAELDTLTSEELDRLADEGAAGVRVLTGLASLERWTELSAVRVGRLCEISREWADVIVCDLGSRLDPLTAVAESNSPRRDAAARAILEHADEIIAVGSADPVSLARLVRAWPQWKEASNCEPRLVINRVRSRALGLDADRQTRDVCRRFLSVDPDALLPEDSKACDHALLAAESLASLSNRSPLVMGLNKLADVIKVQSPVAAAPRRTAWQVVRAAYDGARALSQ